MARILVVIPSASHVRNLVQSGGLGALASTHDCVLIASESITDPDDVRAIEAHGPLLGRYGSDATGEQRHAVLFDALMWRHRGRSRTFLYRWMRTAAINQILTDRGPWIRAKSTVRWFLWLVRKWTPVRAVILGSRPVHPLARALLIRAIPENASLRQLLGAAQPDLVVYPTNAYESTGMDLVRLTRRTGVPSLFVVDNWDNLSSKTVMWAPPDHLAVWGEQSREHAVEIQGMDPAAVSVIGTARFDAYYAARTTRPASPYPFPYVLFVGAALANDELHVLRILDDLLDGRPDGLRVIYRPHPWPQPRAVDARFEPTAFRNVDLDAQFLEGGKALSLGPEEQAFQPDLGWYPALLANARLVMGPLTTMLLEGSVCQRRVLALAHDDGIHFTSPSQAYRWYRHFEGIEDIEGFTVCHDLERLPEMFDELAATDAQPDPGRIDRSVDRFVHHDGRPFGERLLETVEKVLADAQPR